MILLLLLLVSGELTDQERTSCAMEITAIENHKRSSSGRSPAVVQAVASAYDQALERCRARVRAAVAREKAVEEAGAAIRERDSRIAADRKAEEESAAAARRRGAEADAAFDQLVATARRDRKTMQVVHTLCLCDAVARRAMALEGIAKERRYAKVAGVVSRSELQDQKELLMEADDDAAAARSELKAIGAKALACGHKAVDFLADCVNEDNPTGACFADEMRARRRLFQEARGAR